LHPLSSTGRRSVFGGLWRALGSPNSSRIRQRKVQLYVCSNCLKGCKIRQYQNEKDTFKIAALFNNLYLFILTPVLIAFALLYITPFEAQNMASRLSWQSLRARPALFPTIAVAGIGAYYGTRSFLMPTGHAESPEPPKVFGGFGFTTLRLQDVTVVNHNTKRLVFEFPDEQAKSGLTLTCMLTIFNCFCQLCFTDIHIFQRHCLHTRGLRDNGSPCCVPTHPSAI
jgi:hypothetical protein